MSGSLHTENKTKLPQIDKNFPRVFFFQSTNENSHESVISPVNVIININFT